MRKPQWELLVEALRKNPQGLTIRELHVDLYLQNVPDAAMQARRKGFIITTEHLHDNQKIATYKLHEEAQMRLV